jgi:hypothetical protein
MEDIVLFINWIYYDKIQNYHWDNISPGKIIRSVTTSQSLYSGFFFFL